MPRIKHIALATSDWRKTATFYKEALGLVEVGQVNSPEAVGCYLSDGYINVAILEFLTDAAADTEGAPRYTGLHHFGIQVEDMEKSQAKMLNAGAQLRPHQIPTAPGEHSQTNVEVKFIGPDGVTVDLSEAGWVGPS